MTYMEEIMNNNQLNSLKENDVYSMLLFALYQSNKLPEYSTLSELIYILDKEPLLKLCEYFGGTTIKIPTIDDLEILIYALLIYQKVDIDKSDLDTVIKQLELKSFKIKQIKEAYKNLCDVMQRFEFDAR